MVKTEPKTQIVLYPPVNSVQFYFPWSCDFPDHISENSSFIRGLGTAFIEKKLCRKLVFKDGFREEKIKLVGNAFVPVSGTCVIHLEIQLCRPCKRGEEIEDFVIDWMQAVIVCNLDSEIRAVNCRVIDSLSREQAERYLIQLPEAERGGWTLFYAFDKVCPKPGHAAIKTMAHFHSLESKGKGFLNWFRRMVGIPSIVIIFKDRYYPYMISTDNKICLV